MTAHTAQTAIVTLPLTTPPARGLKPTWVGTPGWRDKEDVFQRATQAAAVALGGTPDDVEILEQRLGYVVGGTFVFPDPKPADVEALATHAQFVTALAPPEAKVA